MKKPIITYNSQGKIAVRTVKLCISLLVVMLFLTSCSDWFDINDNPDVPQDVGYKNVLPSGISSVAYVLGGRYQVLGALWSQHWTQSPGASQYSGLDSYDINSSTFDDNQFGELYSGALQNLEYVKNESFKAGHWNYYLMATVMQAYTFQILADLYNQIPFSEALKGSGDELEPHFEKGRDIYDSLITRINYALSLDYENDELEDIEGEDLIFGGDIEKWVAFANTLKLKIYLRQTEANPVVAEAGIRELFDNEVDFLEEDAALDLFTNEAGRRNPLYDTEVNVFGNNPNLILSKTLYSFLVENNDFDRLDYLFNTPANGGEHKALEQGNYYAPDEPAGINSNSYSKPVFRFDAPVYLMSYSESCFLQAEAIIRFYPEDYDDAKEKYDEGVRQSFNRITGVINESSVNLVLGGSYSFPSEGSELENFIESIIVQKWIALSGIQNLETFFEHNRTRYPKISPVPADDNNYEPGEFSISVNNVTSGKFPKRLIFPESEYASNRNTPPKKDVWEKIWWDTKQE